MLCSMTRRILIFEDRPCPFSWHHKYSFNIVVEALSNIEIVTSFYPTRELVLAHFI